jgi:ribosomal protein S18 acetylase RimI-like enzyme
MNTTFRELLAFHIEAQRGMFIDEAARAADGSGVWIFSARESDPTWNLFAVLDADVALRHEARIAREFDARRREPVWYLADRDGTAQPHPLPPPWRRFSSDCWMARDGADPAPPVPGLSLMRVETAADAETFNRLYADAFWDGEPDPGAAVPIPDSVPDAGGWMEIRHWLVRESGVPKGLLSAVSRGGLTGLYNVGTLRSERGRGLGRALLQMGLAEEARRGAARFFLLTERDKPLEAFYRRFGFRTVTTGGYYRKG